MRKSRMFQRYVVTRQYDVNTLMGPDYWQRIYFVRPHWWMPGRVYKRLTWVRFGPPQLYRERLRRNRRCQRV